MANTYTLINSYSATGTVASIDFTSIPSTYTDLYLVLSGRSDRAGLSTGVTVKFNGSSTGYTNRELYGSGSTVGSYNGTVGYAGYVTGTTATASTFSNTGIYIPNYAGSNNKSFSVDAVMENNATASDMGLYANLWANSAAINQITLTANSANFVQYSTAYLYGVKNA